jgi:UDP-glucose 4-epimerase
VRALVTGGAGFIGSHIVRRLLTDGYEVRVVDNLATGRFSNIDEIIEEIDFRRVDIRDLDAMKAAVHGCDAIFHLAALPSVPRSIADPIASHDTNATGTLNVLVAARDGDVPRVVLASSSSIYGANPDLPKREEMLPLPLSPYAVSKQAGESYARSFYNVYGLETVALRYFNVFGPRQDPNSQYSAVIPKFIHAFRHGERPVVNGDGEQSRDFTYVENVVNANMGAMTASGVGGRIYNVACGHGITLNEIATKLRDLTASNVDVVRGPERPGDVRHSMADITRATTDLGYTPSVELEEGLRLTVEHYIEVDRQAEASGDGRAVAVAASAAVALSTNGAHAYKRRRGGEQRLLITGGAGFIGSHLIEGLLASDRERQITILDDLSTGSMENIAHLVDGERVTFVRGSATDAPTVDELMQDAELCVHLASAVGVQMIVNEPLATLMTSVRASNVVMHAASRHDVKVLFSSTSEVYGKQTHNSLTEDDDLVFGSPARGRWTYAIAKSFGEALIHGYHRQRGADAVVVRLFNTVGPRQTGHYGMVLPRFVRQALAGQDLTVYGDGGQTRCFTHVRDTVAALIALCESRDTAGRTFNIGSSIPVAVAELARRVIERSGSTSGIITVPYEQAYGPGFEELGSRRPDTTALRTLTGWEPRRTVDDAIDDVIAHERMRLAANAAPEHVAQA